MSKHTMSRREILRGKLQDLFLSVRGSMNPYFSIAYLYDIGVDISQFNIAQETLQGGPYFRPMSQERLSSLDKRPDMYQIPFWEDDRYPSNADAYMVQTAINDQLCRSRDDDV
ncbi:hypothetical protein EPUS_05188 [Endocarpon pusillum Z07020]|uniref:Uncharacterized protein n=1 Tax=Endocarpon pusillum (strain Z07020 / HMAS-L-300199) TaxID=1263415 RepID=U1HMV9_ENDPU|nr:uncharacterized protein EPUS_05188 [Endocarpon pusillum Z07020]ERF70369.1 hypothetical protein EPUS_05188 [Endocarpon pusillum Z07020]